MHAHPARLPALHANGRTNRNGRTQEDDDWRMANEPIDLTMKGPMSDEQAREYAHAHNKNIIFLNKSRFECLYELTDDEASIHSEPPQAAGKRKATYDPYNAFVSPPRTRAGTGGIRSPLDLTVSPPPALRAMPTNDLSIGTFTTDKTIDWDQLTELAATEASPKASEAEEGELQSWEHPPTPSPPRTTTTRTGQTGTANMAHRSPTKAANRKTTTGAAARPCSRTRIVAPATRSGTASNAAAARVTRPRMAADPASPASERRWTSSPEYTANQWLPLPSLPHPEVLDLTASPATSPRLTRASSATSHPSYLSATTAAAKQHGASLAPSLSATTAEPAPRRHGAARNKPVEAAQNPGTEKPDAAKLRNWVFTIQTRGAVQAPTWEPSASNVEVFASMVGGHSSIDYLIVGLERTQGGRLHWQGYLETNKPMTRWQIMEMNDLMALAWFGGRRGTQQQAIDYIKGEGRHAEKHGEGEEAVPGGLAKDLPWCGPHEFGKRHPGHGNKQTDLHEAAERIRAGATIAEIAHEMPVTFIRHHRGLNALVQHEQKPRDFTTRVLWFWGDTGTGKTRLAHMFGSDAQRYVWTTLQGQWYDGYAGQPVAVFDEVEIGWATRIGFNTLVDRYAQLVQVKGGMAQWKPRVVIITSNLEPRACFAPMEDRLWATIERRLTFVRYFSSDEHMPAHNAVAILRFVHADRVAELEANGVKVPHEEDMDF